eukprot:GEZU01020712.1.p1 GENE.GEZU01020712.1~~GEZU01020712.1.p1  ORF type:complete len:308 (-),score=61.05 GEZU01020712.1:83-1006(-)
MIRNSLRSFARSGSRLNFGRIAFSSKIVAPAQASVNLLSSSFSHASSALVPLSRSFSNNSTLQANTVTVAIQQHRIPVACPFFATTAPRLRSFSTSHAIRFSPFVQPSTKAKTRSEVSLEDCMLDIEEYKKIRRSEAYPLKARIRNARRVEVGPFISFTFENYDTVWLQIHEMVVIEKGGKDQFLDELEAYNPLVPKGKNLVATMMIEIDNPVKRKEVLHSIGYIENMISLEFGPHSITAVPLSENRTNEQGKTSSVHFLSFPFTEEQIRDFSGNQHRVTLKIGHEKYPHATMLSKELVENLKGDFF